MSFVPPPPPKPKKRSDSSIQSRPPPGPPPSGPKRPRPMVTNPMAPPPDKKAPQLPPRTLPGKGFARPKPPPKMPKSMSPSAKRRVSGMHQKLKGLNLGGPGAQPWKAPLRRSSSARRVVDRERSPPLPPRPAMSPQAPSKTLPKPPIHRKISKSKSPPPPPMSRTMPKPTHMLQRFMQTTRGHEQSATISSLPNLRALASPPGPAAPPPSRITSPSAHAPPPPPKSVRNVKTVPAKMMRSALDDSRKRSASPPGRPAPQTMMLSPIPRPRPPAPKPNENESKGLGPSSPPPLPLDDSEANLSDLGQTGLDKAGKTTGDVKSDSNTNTTASASTTIRALTGAPTPLSTVSKRSRGRLDSHHPKHPKPVESVEHLKDADWSWASEIAQKMQHLHQMNARRLGRIWFADEIKHVTNRITQTQTALAALQTYLRALKVKLHPNLNKPKLFSSPSRVSDSRRDSTSRRSSNSSNTADASMIRQYRDNAYEVKSSIGNNAFSPPPRPPPSMDRLQPGYLSSMASGLGSPTASSSAMHSNAVLVRSQNGGTIKKKRRFRPIKNVRKFLKWAIAMLIRDDRKSSAPGHASTMKGGKKFPDRVRKKSSVVFNKTLEELVRDEEQMLKSQGKESLGVPTVLIQLLESLWDRGLKVEGIFRKSGSSDLIAEFAGKVDSNTHVDWSTVDIHVTAGVLKKFLRNLGNPLIPFHMYDAVVGFDKKKQTVQALDYVISYLPEKEETIVFAPNILRKKDETTQTFILDMKNQHRVVTSMIKNFELSSRAEEEYLKLRSKSAGRRNSQIVL
ncbi:hypothetical protein AAMO2058_000787200 [Amorphochlora amoebiformis]